MLAAIIAISTLSLVTGWHIGSAQGGPARLDLTVGRKYEFSAVNGAVFIQTVLAVSDEGGARWFKVRIREGEHWMNLNQMWRVTEEAHIGK